MKTLKPSLLATAILTASTGGAIAQEQPTVALTTPATRGPAVSVNVTDAPLPTVLSDLSRDAQITILVEPGVNGTVTANLMNRPLDDVMAHVTGTDGPVWARVEIVQKQNAPLPKDEALFDLARTLNALPSQRLSVDLSEGGTVTASRTTALARAPQPAAGEAKTSLYVVANRRGGSSFNTLESGANTETVNRYAEMTQRQMELMQQMTPQERQQAIQQEALYMLNLSPQDRLQMMMDRRNAMRSLPDDVRQQLRQGMREAWSLMGREGRSGRGEGRGPRDEGRGNRGGGPNNP